MLIIKSFSDQHLINFILEGGRKESKAIEYLLTKNKKVITTYVLKNSGERSDASSVLVEGVTHLVFNLRQNKFKGESKLSTYLFSICRGVWLKELKKRKRLSFLEDTEAEELIESYTPLQFFSEKQLKEEVEGLLEKLGEACRTVLKLWANHYSMTEISNSLGYKNSQIAMNKKNKCLNQLKAITLKSATTNASLKSYLNY